MESEGISKITFDGLSLVGECLCRCLLAGAVLCQVPRPVGRGRKPLSYMTMVCLCLLALCGAGAHWHELWFAGVPKPVGRGCDGVKKCGKKAVELYDNGTFAFHEISAGTVVTFCAFGIRLS